MRGLVFSSNFTVSAVKALLCRGSASSGGSKSQPRPGYNSVAKSFNRDVRFLSSFPIPGRVLDHHNLSGHLFMQQKSKPSSDLPEDVGKRLLPGDDSQQWIPS